MSQTTTVGLTITLEAAAHVRDDLGMQEQFEQMLEHARQVIPGIYAFDVSLLARHGNWDDIAVVIDASSDDPSVRDFCAESEWYRWKMESFPVNVWEHFTLFVIFSPSHAR